MEVKHGNGQMEVVVCKGNDLVAVVVSNGNHSTEA
jgi:hypothetical protein